MFITKVSISPTKDLLGTPKFHPYFDNASYLTLAISEWIKGFKLDLGKFNEIVLCEGSPIDFELVSNGFWINIEETYQDPSQFRTEQLAHEYFCNKYLEGFSRFDEKFETNLTIKLKDFLHEYFKKGLFYEKQKLTKTIGKYKYLVIYHYKHNQFQLILRIKDKSKQVISEHVLATDEPSLLMLYYNFNKVRFLDNTIVVYDHANNVEKEFGLNQYFIH